MFKYLIAKCWPHILVVLIYTAIVGLIGHAVGGWQGNKRAAKAELALSHLKRDTAYQLAEAEAKAREIERRRVESIAEIEAKHASELGRIESEVEALVSDLRAGNLRLHQRWQACTATGELSAAAARSGIADAGADDRAESASRIVRAAAECDAQVRGLQAVIRADRERVGQ